MVHLLTLRNSEKRIFLRMCLNICSIYSSHEVVMILCKKSGTTLVVKLRHRLSKAMAAYDS